MNINRQAFAVLLGVLTMSISTLDAADNPPNAQATPGATAAQTKPELVQDARSVAENRGAQKQIRKRVQVKQGSPPADIRALHQKSK